MLTEERKKWILNRVNEQTSVSVAELSDSLQVSEVTVRKLLNQLDEEGYLKRTRGGAISMTGTIKEFAQKEKEKKNIAEKRQIAQLAYQLIQDGDSVCLDAGSTTLELARLIKNGNKKNLVVVTNAINIALELVDAEDTELILIGGSVRHRIQSCVGYIAQNALDHLNFKKFFLGSNGISLEGDVTTPNECEAQMKRAMLEKAQEVYLVADSSKYEYVTLTKICSLSDITGIITDENISDEYLEIIREKFKNLKIITPLEVSQ